eukprot:TRINITY_DN58181_c0_g1_i1.p1 TRINITY_DN58181_c0_g1~~TRINITY_DN58181_c0_g1_i1.p1  ORF type:complete len:248 (-),score=14.60 TRINITY_DN58181_c0_g1_i1:106-849(-)
MTFRSNGPSRDEQRLAGWSNTVEFGTFEHSSMESIENHRAWRPKLGLKDGRQVERNGNSVYNQSAQPSTPWGSLEDAFPTAQRPPALRDAFNARTQPRASLRDRRPRKGDTQAIRDTDGIRCTGAARNSQSAPVALLAGTSTQSGRNAADGSVLCAGARVRIDGLVQQSELNGAAGVLLEFDEVAGRWRVEVCGGVKAIRPENLWADASKLPVKDTSSRRSVTCIAGRAAATRGAARTGIDKGSGSK